MSAHGSAPISSSHGVSRSGSPTVSNEFDQPLSGSIWRCRTRSEVSTLESSEQERKQLKQEAQDIARQNKIPLKLLLQLAEVDSSYRIHLKLLLMSTKSKSLASMVLHLAAWILKQEQMKEDNEATSINISLNSKDFEARTMVFSSITPWH